MLDEYDVKWIEKVRAKCIKDKNGCWLWQGFIGHWGYGQVGYRGKSPGVHRTMLSIKIGRPLAPGEQALHTCDVRHCCNPAHLWVGTHALNQRDKADKGRVNYSAAHYKHCKNGHEFNAENMRVDSRGFRQCIACQRIRLRIKAGWPAELARTMPATPKGQRPVKARWAALRNNQVE